MARIVFADAKLKKAFDMLKAGPYEDKTLHEFLVRAFEDIKKKPACGIQIPNRLMPKEYVRKYGIDNLWKYNLPNAWRLLYSMAKDDIEIIAIVLEWLDHKSYERRFGY